MNIDPVGSSCLESIQVIPVPYDGKPVNRVCILIHIHCKIPGNYPGIIGPYHEILIGGAIKKGCPRTDVDRKIAWIFNGNAFSGISGYIIHLNSGVSPPLQIQCTFIAAFVSAWSRNIR
ncbi:hypothetical protein [Akkermansia muciniphila]|uniref:hypothetical protein n=1 Tax=Akkermansia muciniphila TaxID=239935 RepID=UPI001BFEFD6A|nr:hypothetical protein [Akkermansia muciniphila]MBT8777293.1 hypothetical protein [Akkermansia muciniphila]